IEVATPPEQLVGPPRGKKGMLDGPDALDPVVERGGNQARARCDTGEEFRLVDGQLVLAPGEEAQPGMKPVREGARDVLDAFAKFRFRKQPVGTRAARAGTARDDGVDARIEGGGDERGLAVARVAGERNLVRLHKRQRVQIIDTTAG